MLIGVLGYKSTSTPEQTYTFTDTKLEHPVSYYRLKSIGTDGRVTYSAIKEVNNRSANFSASLQSNPVHSQLAINFVTNTSSQVTISVYSTGGVLLLQNSSVVSPGVSSRMIDVSRLTSGSYLVRVLYLNNVTTLKFIKQ